MLPKINKTKTWFFEKINKIDKPLADTSRKKGRKVRSTELEIKKKLHRVIFAIFLNSVYMR